LPRKKAAETEASQGTSGISQLNLLLQAAGENTFVAEFNEDGELVLPDDVDVQGVLEHEASHESEADHYYTVLEITQHIQAILSEDEIVGFPIRVRGELSNVKHSSRGHVYFTLKDEGAALSGIMWASKVKLLPFRLEDGMAVDVTGTIEIYPPSGSYSIKCDQIDPVGAGTLQMAFEQLKQRLTAEGLFDDRYKKAIPPFPRRIGIITSRTGAVIHDMLRVIRRKNQLVDVLIKPVQVQGDGAALSIAAAIQELNHPAYRLDTLIVARGGGSFEDLFCFSEEPVVRAIFNSTVPVVTGIGHEPDFGLADAVADYTASTPTAAAEISVPDLGLIAEALEKMKQMLADGLTKTVMLFEQRLDTQATQFVEGLERAHLRAEEKLQQATQSLLREKDLLFQHFEHQIQKQAATLDAYNPLKTLARGYSVATNREGNVIQTMASAPIGSTLQIHLSDGQLACEVKEHHARS
jgi:exodeoxyribonuclease VII large subunit